MNKYIALAVLVILLAVGGFFLYQNRSQTASVTTPAPTMTTEATMAPSPTALESTVTELTVTGSAFKFDPAEIRVKKGTTIKLTFKNAQGTHDFVVDEFNAKTKVIQSGQEETIEFTVDKAGTFEYYCSVGNHRAMGMKGMLIVE